MEELIEWLADFFVNLYTGNFLWFIGGIILITIGVVMLVRDGSVLISIVFIGIGIVLIGSQFLKADKK